MLNTYGFLPSPLPETVPIALAGNGADPLRRKRLRLYLVGSDTDTQRAIDYFHIRNCIERIEWSQAIAVPENGILIRRDPGDVLRYLQREGQRSLLGS